MREDIKWYAELIKSQSGVIDWLVKEIKEVTYNNDWLVNEVKELKEDNFALHKQLVEHDKAIKGKHFQMELSNIEQMRNQFKDTSDEITCHVFCINISF